MSPFKACLVSTAAALAATSALAADLPSRRAPASYYAAAPVFTWTGFYAGLNAGAAINNSGTSNISTGPAFGSFLDSTTAGYRSSKSEVGFTGGAQAGYNHQWNQIVAGLETDINYADVTTRRSGTGAASFGGIGYSESLASRDRTNYFGTLRGRIGFLPMERMMVYGTGGLAYGDVDSKVSASATVAAPGFGAFTSNYAGGRSTTQVGYTIGGGIEYAITNNVTLKGEYLYVDLGRTSTTASYLGGASVAGDNFTTRNSTEFSVARAGLNWKFNGF